MVRRGKKNAKIIIKINERSYRLLKKYAKGGDFKIKPKNRDGYYYISIEKKVYDMLKKIDGDLDKAIFYLCLNQK